MDNNKNRLKEHMKSNSELRKMFPRDGSSIGIKDGVKSGVTRGKRYIKKDCDETSY